MKIGVLQFFSWPERRVPLETVYARALERIEIMDRTGYDAVWLAEHHFTSFSVCPSVHMMGVLAAARTKRLRIGTGVSLAPFYHPLRLAEEVALLDVLSGGRVNWGAGRGFARVEFETFGVPPEESASRFREAVEIVLRAWTEERLSFAGKHFHFDGVEVLPKPLQQPAPAGMDGGDLGIGDRLGGGARLLDPDGPACGAPRSRPQAALLCREAGRRPGFRRRAATCRWRGCWRSATRSGGRGRSRGAARNGSSIPISARSTTRSASRTRPRRAPTRCSAISTASSCTARPSRCSTRSCGCARRSASTTCLRAAQPPQLHAADREDSAAPAVSRDQAARRVRP